MTSTSMPDWASTITTEVVRSAGVRMPVINWKTGTGHPGTSGSTSKERINITAGTDEKDQKLVLLHELAHWIMIERHGMREGHTPLFWAVAFDLYEYYGLGQYAAGQEIKGLAWDEAKNRGLIKSEIVIRTDEPDD